MANKDLATQCFLKWKKVLSFLNTDWKILNGEGMYQWCRLKKTHFLPKKFKKKKNVVLMN